MRHIFTSAFAFAAIAAATPALAADEPAPALKVSGSVALVSDYRLRGVSQTNNGLAVQGGLTLNHESGAYGGFWASNLAGWGTFGGPNLELDLFAGYKFPLGSTGGALDLGGTLYQYPGGASKTTFFEPYAKLTGTAGPVALTAAVAYAWNQTALGNWYNHPDSVVGSKHDNLYLWGDAAWGIKNTPVTLKAHLGHSNGNPGLGPNGTSAAPTGKYWDWLIGADFVAGPVVLGVAYVDTDISTTSLAYQRIQPSFSKYQIPGGDSISSARVVFSISAAF